MKPYYEHAGIRIFHGNCLDILPFLPPADLIFTSPPYNLGGAPWPHLGHWKPGDSPGGKSKWRNSSDGSGGVTYASHADTMPHAEYIEWQHAVLRMCWDGLSTSGAIFYNHKPRVIGGKLWLPLELNPDLPLRQIVIWQRAGGMNFTPTAYLPTHEWIMIFARESWRLRDKGASGAGDIWYVPQSRTKSIQPHSQLRFRCARWRLPSPDWWLTPLRVPELHSAPPSRLVEMRLELK